MSNPLLTDKAMGLGNLNKPADQWAPPTGQEPMTDGPVSRWDGGIMTVSGTASATMVLLVLLLPLCPQKPQLDSLLYGRCM